MNFKFLTHNLKLDSVEFNFQYQSHPNFPSILALSDTLTFFNIKNDVYELEDEYWNELPSKFVTIYKEKFVFVKKNKSGYTIYSESEEKISKDELVKNSQNIVLLFDYQDSNSENRNFKFQHSIFFIFSFILVYSIFHYHWAISLYNLFSIIGVYLSLVIYNKKIGVESDIFNRFCNEKIKSAQNNCTKIIKSDKINIYGLTLSDLSFVYFLTLLILGILGSYTNAILKSLSILSCIIIFYSITIQFFIEKAFCKLCALIISILIIQTVISYLFCNNKFSTDIIVLSLFTFLALFLGMIFLNNLIKEKEKYKKISVSSLKFKKNYDLFKRQLLLKKKQSFNYKEVFFLGNKNAKLHISLISNPYCSFCREAHHILKELLEKYPQDISAQIRFNYEVDENYKKLLSDFIFAYDSEDGRNFLNAINFWFNNRDEKKLGQKYNIGSIEHNLNSVINISNENKMLGYNFTPILFLNGYEFPEKYEREDVFYFIDELLEDEDIT